MAQRTVAVYRGKPIGIESIYTVVNGRQLNIPEKVEALRTKSRNNELFCPCGCGAKLVLVAGDRNLREQHFRIRDGQSETNCKYVMEGKASIDAKIVLKCWLEDKLHTADIESRVPVDAVDDTERKYEFTFISKSKHLAVSYCRDRENLSDEKLEILQKNGKGIQIIYIVDQRNEEQEGQYPEWLMKIQKRQGYCLFLAADDFDYTKARLEACFYMQGNSGFWKRYTFSAGRLAEYNIAPDGMLRYGEASLRQLKERKQTEILAFLEEEKDKIRKETERLPQRAQQFQEDRKKEIEEKKRLDEEQKKAEKKHIIEMLQQQEKPVFDSHNCRWIKCEYCEKISTVTDFTSFGGAHHVNLGICKECYRNNPEVRRMEEIRNQEAKIRNRRVIKPKDDPMRCPDCGGRLQERRGRFGKFIGCSNYPKCRYTRDR